MCSAHVEIEDFAHNPDNPRNVTFGINAKGTAASLRRLADQVEAGQVFVTECKLSGVAAPEGFTLRRLEFEYAANRDYKPEGFGGEP